MFCLIDSYNFVLVEFPQVLVEASAAILADKVLLLLVKVGLMLLAFSAYSCWLLGAALNHAPSLSAVSWLFLLSLLGRSCACQVACRVDRELRSNVRDRYLSPSLPSLPCLKSNTIVGVFY